MRKVVVAMSMFAFLVTVSGPLNAQEKHGPYEREDSRAVREPDQEPLDVVTVSEKLAAVDDLFAGGNGVSVTFDSQRALRRGTDPTVISLAQELASYTNDLVRTADDFVNHRSSANPMDLLPSPDIYPAVSRFFQAAAELQQGESNKETSPSAQARRAQALGWCNWAITDAACTCGHWLNPQPAKAAPWVTYKASNPSATLQSWGYHQTPSFAGGGWTRAQTYYASRCGSGTFRDQALINSDGKSFREQNYAGFTPRGEPNPEFWTSWWWPYPAWPAYVSWWHSTH